MVEGVDTAMRVIADATAITPAPHVAARIARFAGSDNGIDRDGIARTAALLAPEQLRGQAMLPDPLPVPRSGCSARMEAMDAASRRVLTVAALAAVNRVDILLAAAAVEMAVVLGEHVMSSLIFRDGRFRFADERLRAHLHAECAASVRDGIHGSLSRAAASAGEQGTASWHALLAEAAPPRSTAPLLAHAEGLLRSGAPHGAFQIAREVARRVEGEPRAEALMLAARAALAHGCPEQAGALLEQAERGVSRTTESRVAELREAVTLLRRGVSRHTGKPISVVWQEGLDKAGISPADAAAIASASRGLALAGEAEADVVQAAAQLSAVRARSPWPWTPAPGALSPAVEAVVRGRTIAVQMHAGDIEGAAMSLRTAIDRLPLARMVAGDDAAAIQDLLRCIPGRTDLLSEAFGARAERTPTRPVPDGTHTSAAARAEQCAGLPVVTVRTRTDASLSPRQRQILALMLEGKRNQEVAEDLGISHRTVEVHITAVLRKLGVRNRVELLAASLRPDGVIGRSPN